jgi:uncharacterized protein
MKFILLFAVRLYWTMIPVYSRKPCLFEESCSKYVYRITKENGFFSGLFVLKERFHQCRPGYKMFKNEKNNSFELHLKDGSIITHEKISPTLLPHEKLHFK